MKDYTLENGEKASYILSLDKKKDGTYSIKFADGNVFDKIEADEDLFNPETGEVILGDIVLCKERIYSQAEEYGHSVLREYAFLIAHSMLHLFGFDHMTEEEAAVMEEKQREILDTLGISRD